MNAHSSQINCITALNDESQMYATGAIKDIKVWRLFDCVHVIPNAHTNAILSLKTFRVMNQLERKFEQVLVSGSKDKQLKIWSLTSVFSSEASSD
jgi:WD40 repeat protein